MCIFLEDEKLRNSGEGRLSFKGYRLKLHSIYLLALFKFYMYVYNMKKYFFQ